MPDQRHCSSLYSNSMQYVRCTVIELHAGCQMWQYLHCTVIVLHFPSCYSIYIVQLLNYRVPAVRVCTLYSYCPSCDSMYIVKLLICKVPAVTVCTLYSYCTVGSQLWRKCLLLYSYCTAGPELLRRCMYIIQLLYCRVPAVREVYAHYIVIVLQGPSCEGGVCTLYSYCTAGSKLWGRCLYRILSQQRKMYRGIQSIQIQTKPPSFKD